MAVYNGFFDAVVDEETGEFDRAYGPGDFTGYFAHIIGSGVCIHNNQDSYKAEFEGDTLYLRPGYLFIQGYWLANKPGPDEDPATYKGYAVTLPAEQTGPLAVVAHLNLGKRIIEIEARSVSQAYPDSLVLAIVSPTSAEDTRHNTDICGTIDTAGELSKKVEWAVNYIDNEIEDKLAAAESDIAEQSKKLDAKIAEVQAQVDKITPPPVGSIKFSASQNVGPEWLPCNGDFVSESQYPELVAALGKLTPSGDKFKLLSDGGIGPQISNGVIYNGRMWVYSYSAKNLYGVDLDGTAAVKEIPVTSDDVHFGNFTVPTTAKPIALSIIPHKTGTGAKLFLGQYPNETAELTANSTDSQWIEKFLLFQCDFSGNESVLTLSLPFEGVATENNSVQYNFINAVPYVCSRAESEKERYFTFGIKHTNTNGRYYPITWIDGENAIDYANIDSVGGAYLQGPERTEITNERYAFSHKNGDEAAMAVLYGSSYGGSWRSYEILSIVNQTFDFNAENAYSKFTARTSILPLNIIGDHGLITSFTPTNFPVLHNDKTEMGDVKPGISLPSAARVFVDAGAYLWGKDIYMIFVGTGIIFSRTLENGSFGYLDTTSVLGTITQFGYLDYSQDEGTIYLLGQDTSNRVKVAKIVLNTLYDYANDGAWLPMIAADGVPAYIKAYEPEEAKT